MMDQEKKVDPHYASQDTYDFLSQWIAPDFFFSKKDLWDRMGMLAVFGDYVLSCTQGDVLEIGAGESSLYLSKIARKYKRRIYHCDIARHKITNYLTVDGYLLEGKAYPTSKFDETVSHQEDNCVFFFGPSDDLFSEINPQGLALSFIDGDHVYTQAKKDFDNVLSRTVDNGWIFIHDTYPPEASWVNENQCGNVYKLRQEIEKDDNLDCITLVRGSAMGVGLTLVRKKPLNRDYYHE